jgi:hypothetical protein
MRTHIGLQACAYVMCDMFVPAKSAIGTCKLHSEKETIRLKDDGLVDSFCTKDCCYRTPAAAMALHCISMCSVPRTAATEHQQRLWHWFAIIITIPVLELDSFKVIDTLQYKLPFSS